MRRRIYKLQFIEIILAVAVIGLVIALAFVASKLTPLYPITFALAAVLSGLHFVEGFLSNPNRREITKRAIVFGIITLILIVLAVVSAIVVFRR